ncbi:MAG TPA: Orn/Lys/Arg decarboxylase N-terminal domain-containing protein [Mycobacteriales bacterium]|nr:Orn/Lys/Arg decarboxylase N-terminal domain-containing protein [Mycobacteriales bacterium]
MTMLDRLPLLVVDDLHDRSTVDAEALQGVHDRLTALGVEQLTARDLADATELLHAHPEIGGVLVVWNHEAGFDRPGALHDFAEHLREDNELIPLFLLTQRFAVTEIPPSIHAMLTGCLWAGEDEPDFQAGHIAAAMAHYREQLLPPFFGRLIDYVERARYSWHTPGHMGGVAFLKTPVGRIFHDFFGENVLRADLSSSVPELGSILEHEGVVADAEAEAADAFGADKTLFVTNGTTMSNQIIFRATVSPGDVVLVDRNCHKSIVNSVIQTGAIPIYLSPLRNGHGMIGPVDPAQLEAIAIREKLRHHPLIGDPDRLIRLAIVTNSTYDGTMYDVARVIERLAGQVERILLDEAWIPYAAFHPVYAGRFGMSYPGGEDAPTVFTTMSTHKMLAAFSQASMIHVKQGSMPVNEHRFNEAFMMHTSTSPQYNIVASLDVATRMMRGPGGRSMMDATISEALDFRTEIQRIGRTYELSNDWWFTPWQPDGKLGTDQVDWIMTDEWTGFSGLEPSYTMLDPTKVSLLCPGIDASGRPLPTGIPAAIVAALLRQQGVVVEKTGFYSILVLFSIGVTRGKSATLVETLLHTKRLIDANTPICEALPELYAEHPERYTGLGLRDLADQMHRQLSAVDTGEMQEAIYRHIPQSAMTPGQAFNALIRDEVDNVEIDKLEGRVSAVLCLLYPPGIPVVMPGEQFTAAVQPIVEYLQTFEQWDEKFPGFETEMQGVVKSHDVNGRLVYSVPCVQE